MGIGGSLIKVKNNTKLVWTLNPAYSSIYSSLVSLLSNKPFDFSYKVELIPNAATYSECVGCTADFLDPFLLQQSVRTNSCFLFLLIIAATSNPWDIIHTFAWYFHSPSHSKYFTTNPGTSQKVLATCKGKRDVSSLHDSFCIIPWFTYFGIPEVFPESSLHGVHEFQAPLS
jgi:hypothetical protein